MAPPQQNTPEDISVIDVDIGKGPLRAAGAMAFPAAEVVVKIRPGGGRSFLNMTDTGPPFQILIVDDESSLQEELTDFLTVHGMAVGAAGDGAQAVAATPPGGRVEIESAPGAGTTARIAPPQRYGNGRAS
jgi:hypothetical protein